MDDGDPGPPSRAPSLPVGSGATLTRRSSRAPLLPVGADSLVTPLLPADGLAAEAASVSVARPVTPGEAMPDPYAAADAPPVSAAPSSTPPKDHAPTDAARAADHDARRAAAVTQLEHLRDVARIFENAHDDFYEGLAGIGALLGVGVFFATWVTGLTGLGNVLQAKDNPVFNLVITVAGLVGGALSTVQRVWGPAGARVGRVCVVGGGWGREEEERVLFFTHPPHPHPPTQSAPPTTAPRATRTPS